MSWTIKLSSTAEKKFKRLDRKTGARINGSLRALSNAENPILHRNVKPLVGELKGFYRLRVGDFRVIFALLEDERIIAVVNIASRGSAY
ncbi:type II toxin-antitoxin system RelE/ParE family toxin [Hydrogenivirga sp. 128-5-R1-1]|uniref:type II toxin-antitoxin system RelE family toxin n=1 Tax=Hydrogenivirga sp. 128-5-R1-1 TaxID=392423 RepID=UPI00015EFCC4|nr:type II toxin-antitoxin system RelE/ParE family toxin [Hydrogenivirga sp. 128-5-R1-1]EDP74513.1 toxin-like protein [Hydrogenivirga sp. 128-5-R1-1]